MTLCGFSCNAFAEDTASTTSDENKIAFFESRIRPVLIEHCYECHSAESKILRGGLRVDFKDGLIQGGDSGPAVVAGDQNSRLIRAIRFEDYEMPPGKKLPEDVIKDFETWIRDGAIDPRQITNEPKKNIKPQEAASHWSFQPLNTKEPPTPLIEGQTSIDAFIGQKRMEHGFNAAPKADRYTLLRRLSFDLTGLPPTLDEIQAFVSDPSVDAYERQVERLLSSSAYGERWARHWLDLVRYADTNGADENHSMPVAWRFRDWVVDAFQQDLPFDQFVQQQLAGDLLPQPVDELAIGKQLAATGMLVLGPKMLAEQDKPKMRIDIVDEQIDTLSKTFLGVTLSCARCHDHKFDPFSQRDYFAFAGVMMSTRTMADEAFVSKWMERPLPSKSRNELRAEHQQKIDAAKQTLTEAIDTANRSLLAKSDSTKLPDNPQSSYSEADKQAVAEAKAKVEELEKSMPNYDMVLAVEEQSEKKDLPIHIRGNHLRPTETTVPRGFPVRLTQACSSEPISPQESGRLQLARWLTKPEHPLFARVMVNRVWMWHFGKPLVDTPSNFGLRGSQPSHPELLDWLASNWIASGWSLKWLHRQLVMSETYQMSSQTSIHETMDPENRWYWRQNERRLEVEPLRDAILEIGGSLDRLAGGAPEAESTHRRTIYLKIDRAALSDFLSVFDYVEAANHIEQRAATSVPNQALFLLNSPLVQEQANALAERFSSHAINEGVGLLFLTCFGRAARASEIERCISFLRSVQPTQDINSGQQDSVSKEAWGALIRSLIASREFSYVR